MIILKPFELAYRGINRVRRSLYRRGVLRARRLPRPVISVGNRAVGGAGKTPAVIAIARLLIEHGFRVAILSRGYGRSGGGGIVDALDAERFGDEPVLIKRSVPGADVVVGSDRHAAGLRYLQTRDCDLILLDDGFQHLQLARDVEIVIESRSRWYREGRASLAAADLLLIRDAEGAANDTFTARLRPTCYESSEGRLPMESLRGRSAFAFSGLADNEQFFDTLRSAGLTIAGSKSFPDHHHYDADDLAAIRRQAAAVRASAIVTTEKDAVKLQAVDLTVLLVELSIEPAALFRSSLLALIAATQNGAPHDR